MHKTFLYREGKKQFDDEIDGTESVDNHLSQLGVIKKDKGLQINTSLKRITFEDYHKCLFNQVIEYK
nr:unnamed protein product [Callosobruchus chinensis]